MGYVLILIFFSLFFVHFSSIVEENTPLELPTPPILALQTFFLVFLRSYISSQSILFMCKLLSSFTKPRLSTTVLFLPSSKNSFISRDWMTPRFPFPPLLISLQVAELHWALPALAEEDISLPPSLLDAQCPQGPEMWSLGSMGMFRAGLRGSRLGNAPLQKKNGTLSDSGTWLFLQLFFGYYEALEGKQMILIKSVSATCIQAASSPACGFMG